MPRFSMKWLLGAVAFVGLSIVALLNARWYWHSGLMNVLLVLLAASLAGMIYLGRDGRAFCGGFFIFGMFYFLFATQWWKLEREWRFMPTSGLSALHKHTFVAKNETIPPSGFQGGGDIVSRGQPLPNGSVPAMVVRPSHEAFVGVGNTLLCFLFALLGGVVARRMRRES
jgi:hypothetical protein